MDSKQNLEQTISDGVAELKALLSKCSTESVVGYCSLYHLRTSHGDETERRLTSPAKQIPFLLGVLLSTTEPTTPRDLDKPEWEQARSILERLFSAYMLLYMPTKEQLGPLAEEWYRVREVSMLAFLHYFNNGLLASAQQIASRINVYLAPFDAELSEILGISATQAVDISQWISDQLQIALDDCQEVARAEHEQRMKLIERAEHENWTEEALALAVQGSDYGKKIQDLFDRISKLGVIRRADLESNFPGIGHTFWRQFSVKRGDSPEIRYPTERSVFETSPLIRINETEAFCTAVQYMYMALLLVGERTLLQSPVRHRFLRARDKALEDEAVKILRAFLTPKAAIWSKVYETPDCHFEHDIVAVDEGLCLVIEAKAAPPIEPFRDPDKAFVRLRDSFRADTGIQKAFEQANRIVRKLKDGQDVPLYDANGNEVTRLSPDPSTMPIAICVTRDNFGALATNLALLLEKESTDAYPWAVNIIDFFNLGEAWSYFNWGPSEFRRYLEERIVLHGKVFSDDELDYAGYFVRHGDFRSAIKTKADLLQLNPDYSSVFDEIYRHLHFGEPPVKLKKTEPVLMDLKRSLISDQPVFVEPQRCSTNLKKVGRNDQCPCGSGKKYKRCCGFIK